MIRADWLSAFVVAVPLTLATGLVALAAPGCGSETADVADGGPGGEGGVGEGGIANGDGAPDGTIQTPFGPCTPGTTQCTNCIDDDGDGKIDFLDGECTGNLDNDEGTFGTGIPGDNIDPCKQDCFFDGNSGSGDDGCLWEVGCLRPNPSPGRCPDLDPTTKECKDQLQQSQRCLDKCKPSAPNGCDCFGCCDIPRPDGGHAYVLLESTCNTASLDDPTKCHSCVQQAPGPNSCLNTCDHCELCVGKPELPADCAPPVPDGGTPAPDAGTGQTCGDGRQICNATTLCQAGYYCVTGCCVPQIN
jgi:hypothetical protein